MAKRFGIGLEVGVLGLVAILAACGGGTGSGGNSSGGGSTDPGYVAPTSGEYVWEINDDPRRVLAYAKIDPTTGALSAPVMTSGPVSASSAYGQIAIVPSGKYLYSFFESTFKLNAFELYGPGLNVAKLPPSTTLPLEEGMIIHPSGRFLYVMLSGSSCSIQQVNLDNSTGAFSLGPRTVLPVGLGLPVIDSNGSFLYLAGDSNVYAFQINQTTGALTPVAGSPFALKPNEQPMSLVFGGAENQRYLYGANPDGSIAALAVNSATGALSEIAGSPFWLFNMMYAAISVDPSGKYLYESAPDFQSFLGFSINPSTGELIPLAGSPFSLPTSGGTLTFDPSGKFAYMLDYGGSKIYGFNFDAATGRISAMANSPFPSAKNPRGLTMMKIP